MSITCEDAEFASVRIDLTSRSEYICPACGRPRLYMFVCEEHVGADVFFSCWTCCLLECSACGWASTIGDWLRFKRPW